MDTWQVSGLRGTGSFTYVLSANASGPATTLPTLQGKKLVASINGTGTAATASIPAHGYSGVSITGFSITGSSVSPASGVARGRCPGPRG